MPGDLVVWIVDDAESVRKSIAAVLQTTGLTVRDYDCAQAFLADFQSSDTGCLIVDQHMPDMTGLELLQHMREQGIAIPAILITGQGDPRLKEKCRDAGAITMMDKPVDAGELITLIQKFFPNKI